MDKTKALLKCTGKIVSDVCVNTSANLVAGLAVTGFYLKRVFHSIPF